jgi:hypothetical protein
MEPNSAAEELPALYRAVLDRVGQLEAAGQRQIANRVRSRAIKIYSRAWDERARRELTTLLRRNAVEEADITTAGRSLRRRSIRAA